MRFFWSAAWRYFLEGDLKERGERRGNREKKEKTRGGVHLDEINRGEYGFERRGS